MSAYPYQPTAPLTWSGRRAILDALELLSSAAVWLTDEMAATPAGDSTARREFHAIAVRDPALSPREREVAVLMARGCSNRQIATELCISVATVERHASNIFNKLGVHSRASVAAWAVERGLAVSGAG